MPPQPGDALRPGRHQPLIRGHIPPGGLRNEVYLRTVRGHMTKEDTIMAPKTNNRSTLDQLDPVETLPAVHMAPLVVGPGPLVGAGSTLGVHPNHVRLLRPRTRQLGANVAGALPFVGNIPDRVGEMVERLGDLRQELAAHSPRTRQVAVSTPTHPQFPTGHNTSA